MSSMDNEILLGAEEDAREMQYIMRYLPQEVRERITEDDVYYILDVLIEYYEESGLFEKAENDEFVDVDLEDIVAYIKKKSHKEKQGPYEEEDLLFVVQAEMDYNEQLED